MHESATPGPSWSGNGRASFDVVIADVFAGQPDNPAT